MRDFHRIKTEAQFVFHFHEPRLKEIRPDLTSLHGPRHPGLRAVTVAVLANGSNIATAHAACNKKDAFNVMQAHNMAIGRAKKKLWKKLCNPIRVSSVTETITRDEALQIAHNYIRHYEPYWLDESDV